MFSHRGILWSLPLALKTSKPSLPMAENNNSDKSLTTTTTTTNNSSTITTAKQQGMKIVMIVIFYFITSISLVFLNKYLLSGYKFHYPIFITWFQQIVACVCIIMFTTLAHRGNLRALSFLPKLEVDSTIARQVLPLTLLFVGMLTFNNLY